LKTRQRIETARGSGRRGAAAPLLAALLAGCAAAPLRPEADRLPPLVTTTAEQAAVRDLRAAYRAALCAQLAGVPGRTCGQVLTRMGGEPEPDGRPFPATAELALRYRIAIVPGILGECLGDEDRPYAAAAKELRARGFAVEYLATRGRGSVAANADLLAREIAALPDDPRPLLVFAYSKGLPDLLALLVQSPSARSRIAAVVAMAGAVNGSPLAERYEDLYGATLRSLPFGPCEAGTGEEVHDLRRDVRVAWWRAHWRQIGLPLYSVVALPDQDRVSPALASLHAQLADVDPRNDGQVLWTDAVAAPGALLGYVNADHWAIAVQLSRAFPVLACAFVDDVPRAALLAAAIAVVARDLQAGP
jgi:hypothetical protein